MNQSLAMKETSAKPPKSPVAQRATTGMLARKDLWIAGTLAAASLILYLRTMAPDVVSADGGEFQFAAWNFSIVHPTGYPLFLLLGGLFQHLIPLGSPAFRLNLFTGVTAAAALAVLYLALRFMGQHWTGAMLGAVSMALTATFWFDAGGAEVYDFNAFFIALLILLALWWRAKPSATRLALFALAFGFSLTHHRSILLWAPGFILFFLISAPPLAKSIPWHRAPVILLAFLAPLLLYLYVPLRGPSSPYASLPLDGHSISLYDGSAAGLLDYILGRRFQTSLEWNHTSLARLIDAPQVLYSDFGAIGIALGIAGVIVMTRKRLWAELTLLATGLVATIVFEAAYQIGDVIHYFVPALLAWSMFAAEGASELIQYVSGQKMHGSWGNGLRILAVGLAFVLIPGRAFVQNFPEADRSGENPRAAWTKILDDPIPQKAILLSNDRDEMMPMWYLQYVEGKRRDLLGLFPLITPEPDYANIGRLTDKVLETGRPVFFVKPMPGMEAKYDLEPDGDLVRVSGQVAQALPSYPTTATLGGRIDLVGYDIGRAPGKVDVTLFWRSRETYSADYIGYVQLQDSHGNKVVQGEDHQIGGQFYPSSLWRVGELLRDRQTLSVPSTLTTGPYRLISGMYDRSDMDQMGDPILVATIELP